MVICVAVDCKSDIWSSENLGFYNFARDKNLKQQWFIKVNRRNIQSLKHVRMCHAYCFD